MSVNNGTPMAAFRAGTGLARSTATTVLFFFLWLNVHPALAAAKEKPESRPSSIAAQAGEVPDARALTEAALRSELGALKQSVKPARDLVIKRTRQGKKGETITDITIIGTPEEPAVAEHRRRLQELALKLRASDEQVLQGFAQDAQYIKKHKLSDRLLDRQRKAVRQFKAQSKELHDKIKALQSTPTAAALYDQTEALFKQLTAYQPAPAPFDPQKLPFKAADEAVRKPAATEKELRDLLNPNLTRSRKVAHARPLTERLEPATREELALASHETTLHEYRARSRAAVELAAAGSMTGLLAASAITPPGPEFLAPTEDAQITPAIQALSAQLHQHPVEIYNWVRNEIEFVPTYGSIQGSDMTLQTRKGNAYDMASLLVALLRASNIAARYAYGTVEIPADKVMNWVGGAETVDAVFQLLGQGSIPHSGLTQGGVVKAVRLEHVWAEAFIDYYPSRGAVNLKPDTWVPMDASFKQYSYSAGMNLRQSVPFDAQALITEVQASAEVNEAEGWVSGVDEPIIQNALQAYQTRLQDYVAGQKPDATVGDVLGNKTIVRSTAPTLAYTLPYHLVAKGPEYAALPASLRHKLRMEFFASTADVNYDNPAFTVERSIASLAGKKISFVYEPASEDDKALLDTKFENYETTFPAYMVEMKPVLKIENQVVAGEGSYTTGTGQTLRVTTISPATEYPKDYRLKAGDYMVLALNPGQVTPGVFNARTQAHDLTDGEDEEYTSEMFHQIGLGFWVEEEAYAGLIGDLTGVISHHAPSHGLVGAPVSVTYYFGTPRFASYKSRTLDVKQNLISAVHKRNDAPARVDFARKRGYVGSYLEAGIYDQALLYEPGLSMSAVTAMRKANQDGIRTYQVTPANVNAVLPQLQVDEFVRADIVAATSAGFEVAVPQRDISVAAFTGTGYVITDPQTGAASYLISGGRDGDSSPAAEAVYPLPAAVATAAVGILLSLATMQAAGIGIVAVGGVVTGIAIPVGAAIGPIILAIIIATMITEATSRVIEEKYPRTNRRLRHYTNFAGFAGILADGTFVAGRLPGTFGRGIYFADPFRDSEINNVACPPTGDEQERIRSAYDITDPTKGGYFIDIIITRDNFYKPREVVNAQGVTEVIFPPPVLVYRRGFGIEFFQACPPAQGQ